MQTSVEKKKKKEEEGEEENKPKAQKAHMATKAHKLTLSFPTRMQDSCLKEL